MTQTDSQPGRYCTGLGIRLGWAASAMEECAGNQGKAVHAVERRQPSAKEQVLLPVKLLTVGLWDWGPDGARGALGRWVYYRALF